MINSKPATQQDAKPASNNQPAHRIRMARILATLWKNHGENGPWFNVTFSRSYKDANDEWKSTDSFTADDLLLLAKLANEAHTWIIQKQHDRT